jgi:hypothetical protein
MDAMQEAFEYVLFAVVIVGAIIAIFTLLGTGKLYDKIGEGGLFNDDTRPDRRPVPAEDTGTRDEEIRQMLTARNALRASHGGEQVDVDAELTALTRPAVDPELEAEVRALVEARNRRRVAKGREPLDVDAEVERRIRELSG